MHFSGLLCDIPLDGASIFEPSWLLVLKIELLFGWVPHALRKLLLLLIHQDSIWWYPLGKITGVHWKNGFSACCFQMDSPHACFHQYWIHLTCLFNFFFNDWVFGFHKQCSFSVFNCGMFIYCSYWMITVPVFLRFLYTFYILKNSANSSNCLAISFHAGEDFITGPFSKLKSASAWDFKSPLDRGWLLIFFLFVSL